MGDAEQQEPEKKKRRSGEKGAGGGRRLSGLSTYTPAPKPTMRFQPTYRLEPKNPLKREPCEIIIKTTMERVFEEFRYTPKLALQVSAQLAEEIKNRVKMLNFDRYRYICIVTIGEKVYQGYYSLTNFLWDAEKDGYMSYVIDKPNLFAVATLYYIYYD